MSESRRNTCVEESPTSDLPAIRVLLVNDNGNSNNRHQNQTFRTDPRTRTFSKYLFRAVHHKHRNHRETLYD